MSTFATKLPINDISLFRQACYIDGDWIEPRSRDVINVDDPASPVPRAHGKTSPLSHGAAVAALAAPQSRYPQKQFVGSSGGNRIYNDHYSAPCLPSLFGWFAPPKFTRVAGHHLTIKGYDPFPCRLTKPITSPRNPWCQRNRRLLCPSSTNRTMCWTLPTSSERGSWKRGFTGI